MRPATSAASLASRLGAEARLPLTSRSCWITLFCTAATVTSGAASSWFFLSAEDFPHPASVASTSTAVAIRRSVERGANRFLQCRESTLRSQQVVEIGFAGFVQFALRVHQG